MILKFIGELVKVEERAATEEKRGYKKVKLADPEEYESATFWCNENIDLTGFSKGNRVEALIDLKDKGNSYSVRVVGLSHALPSASSKVMGQ